MQANSSSKLTQLLLLSITLGIWGLFLQNMGMIPSNQKVQVMNTVSTFATGGKLAAEVTNEVMVDLKKINGWPAANYQEYTIEGYEFHSLGIHNNEEKK